MSGPPPPPPLSLGAVPAVRLKAEINESRPEPPACVQNAMMTKDKKPFTYTPGGLDLSQIRSPRMAKRVSRNAQAEGVTGVPQSPMSPGGPGPGPMGGMGGMGGPVGPMGGMPPPPPPPPGLGGPMPPPPPPSGIPSAPKPPSNNNNLPPYSRPDIKIPENPMQLLRKTGGPVVRAAPLIGPDEEITKQPIIGPGGQPMAPPPAHIPVQQPIMPQQPMQVPQQQQQQASPPIRAPQQSPPVQQQGQQPMYRPVRPPQQVFQPQQQSPQPQMYQPPPPPQQMYQPPPPQAQVYQQQQPQQQMQQPQPQQQPRFESRQQIGSLYIPPLSPEELQQKSPPTRSGPESPGSPMDTLKKAPTPWLHARGQQRQPEVPTWARSPPESAGNTAPSTPATPQTPGAAAATRVVPVRIEKEADLIDAQQQQMQQQQMQQQMQWQQQQQQAFQQQQQQWRQQQLQQQQQQQLQQQQQQLQQQQQQFQQQQQPQFRQVHQQSQQSTQQSQQHVVRVIPIQIEGRTNSGPMSPNNNVSTPDIMDGPVQSPTFRVLQRVTSRDEEIHAQPAVPHPATAAQPFTPPPTDQVRRLQLADDDQKFMNRVRNQVPRAVLVNRGPPGVKKNQPGTPTGEQNNVPPSEQRAPEPRKYTGSAIPSRSFQMLQAMVAPENCGPGQSDL